MSTEPSLFFKELNKVPDHDIDSVIDWTNTLQEREGPCKTLHPLKKIRKIPAHRRGDILTHAQPLLVRFPWDVGEYKFLINTLAQVPHEDFESVIKSAISVLPNQCECGYEAAYAVREMAKIPTGERSKVVSLYEGIQTRNRLMQALAAYHNDQDAQSAQASASSSSQNQGASSILSHQERESVLRETQSFIDAFFQNEHNTHLMERILPLVVMIDAHERANVLQHMHTLLGNVRIQNPHFLLKAIAMTPKDKRDPVLGHANAFVKLNMDRKVLENIIKELNKVPANGLDAVVTWVRFLGGERVTPQEALQLLKKVRKIPAERRTDIFSHARSLLNRTKLDMGEYKYLIQTLTNLPMEDFESVVQYTQHAGLQSGAYEAAFALREISKIPANDREKVMDLFDATRGLHRFMMALAAYDFDKAIKTASNEAASSASSSRASSL